MDIFFSRTKPITFVLTIFKFTKKFQGFPPHSFSFNKTFYFWNKSYWAFFFWRQYYVLFRIVYIKYIHNCLCNTSDIKGRFEKLNAGNTYITIKDHKGVFPEKPSFRLINPWKSETKKIGKNIFGKFHRVVIV